jgi:Bifunctional DNA primase/polymerase, N-terminal
MNPRLRAARHYSHQGWFVLPCDPGGNVLCEHGVLDASVDEVVIRTWWERWPRANIGTPTGKHVAVLNVNGPEGEQTLAELTAKHGPLPATAEVQTGKGRHLHFSPNGSMIPNGGGRLGPGVDVLGVGKCVILPPSTDESGLRAEWLSLMEPATLPTWVAQALVTSEAQPQEKSLEGKRDATPAPIGKLEGAKRFLQKALKDGAVDSKAIKSQAATAGYSEKTIYRARNVLGVEVKKVGFGDGQHWEWLLLEGSPQTKVVKKKVKKAIFESSHGILRNQAEASGPKAGENGGLYGAIPPPFPDTEWQPDAQKGPQ